jgi:membrane-associated protease RseP (regulator of RpoE activity)
MNRPSGVTVATVLAYSGAMILALCSFGFFLVGVMVATGDERGDPVSVAISGMALAGGFSLLILAVATAWMAMNVRELRDWARTQSISEILANVVQRLRNVSIAARRSSFAGFLAAYKSRRLEHHH